MTSLFARSLASRDVLNATKEQLIAIRTTAALQMLAVRSVQSVSQSVITIATISRKSIDNVIRTKALKSNALFSYC